ncbi:M13 family metallopeptidase [bacterium]|nr:M13 family metallopeptidase [bacterium]
MNHKPIILLSTLIVISILFSGCTQQPVQLPEPPQDNNAIQHVNMDLSVAPGDDFYRYANGGWIDANPVPEAFAQYSAGTEVWLRNNEQVKAVVADPKLLAAAPGSIERKIGDFYATGMDTNTIDAAGISALKETLEQIARLDSKEALTAMVAYQHKTSSYPLFYVYADQDEKNSEQVIANLTQSGLGMTDRDQYLDDDERSVALREAYQTFMDTIFSLMGDSDEDIKKQINAIMAFETRLAENSMTRVEQRDPEKGYNPMSLSELQSLSPDFDFAAYFSGIGISDPGTINIRQPLFFKAVSDMIADVDLGDWKIYLRWNHIQGKMGALPQTFRDASFAFYGTAVNGTEKPQPRWRQVLGTMNGSLGEAIGKTYVAKHFPPASKSRMLELVENLKIAQGERIKILDWMSAETKEKALAKLATMSVKIGYPDKWTDYSTMTISSTDYGANLEAARSFHFLKKISKIGKPVDREEWFMNPQTVNAYYSPSLNEIVFPAGILQPPFFFPDGDEAVNYGAIGVVIGHEITHGFDDQGRKFDARGNMEDWWIEEDGLKFEVKAQLVVDQYNEFFITDSVHINGELTLGENIADLGGLMISYQAMLEALKTHPEPEKIAGFTQSQRFFLSFAQIWRGTAREAALLQQVQTDPHSPREFRVLGPIVNTQMWYDAFSVEAGDSLFTEASHRIKIW